MQVSILETGSSEVVKAAVHGIALCLVALMGTYNVAAWLQRRQRHLAFNAAIYAALAVFEYQHVCHHRAALAPAVGAAGVAAAVAALEPAEKQAA